MSGKILGISAFYHDSAAALVSDGDIVAAARSDQERLMLILRGGVESCDSSAPWWSPV